MENKQQTEIAIKRMERAIIAELGKQLEDKIIADTGDAFEVIMSGALSAVGKIAEMHKIDARKVVTDVLTETYNQVVINNGE